MHKILFHAGLSPLAQPSMKRVFMDNIFTNNSGNLLFQYGAYRTLMTDDAEITATFFDRQANQSPQSVERFNSEYACAVMPMANNFRGSYNLKPMTRFIRQLKIPCIVMGIGLQASDPSLIAQGFPFDDDVRDFVKAILDHSAILGLRGEMTADYLRKLGFIPERHFTVIGCPSMYSRGLNLPKARPLSLGPDSSVSFGYRIDQPAEMAELLNRGMAEFKNYHIVAQRREEIFMLRYWHFLEIREIAQARGMSTGAVKMSLSRTRAALKEFLTKEEIEGVGFKATVKDVVANPKKLQFKELEAAQLPRSLQDVDIAVITMNYVMSGGLDVKKQGLFWETKDEPLAVMILAVKGKDKDNPTYLKIAGLFKSEGVRKYIADTFKGTIVPAE